MKLAAGTGSLALAAAGALIVAVALVDVFLTLFNYDGFTFVAGRVHRLLWTLLRGGTRVQRGLANGSFTLHAASASLGTAFYLGGGVISTLTFGDVVPRANPGRALVDLESIFGVATFTPALGYVVTTFGVLGARENLHGRVRRHSEDPGRLRFGLPGTEPMTQDPFLAALLDGYEQTLDRLRRSFVGPDPIRAPQPLARDQFEAGGDQWAAQFRRLERSARTAAGFDDAGDQGSAYDRYRTWFPFGYLQHVVLDRVADRLGYEPPSAR